MSESYTAYPVSPEDRYNRELISLVHPGEWNNPQPRGRYNLVVIGAGSAGLITAAGGAGLCARVALVERHLMGGDCLNTGCVPSKALIRASRAAHEARHAGEFGVKVHGVEVDFPAVMERMRRLRSQIAPNDSARRFSDLGIDVYLGNARFLGPNSVEVDGEVLEFSQAVIATGARAAELPIPGLKEAGYLTNETLFNLTELPKRLAVIGAGPIGCEMAQAFNRFGSEVILFNDVAHIMPREDPDAAAIVQKRFESKGVDLRMEASIERIETRDGSKVIVYRHGEKTEEAECDEILVGVGRKPNVEGLGLETAGVEYGPYGVKVDDRLRTTNKKIFAAGDIASRFKFTHAADAMARIVIQNALFFGRKKVSALTIPWSTYTDPEIAHVGLYEKQADEQGIEVDTFTVQLSDVDRAILDGETEGFARVHLKKGTGKILGATVVASHAGDLIGELVLAMTSGLEMSHIASTIHPYPTQGEVLKRLGDAYNRTRLTPWVKDLFCKIMDWKR